MALQGLGVAVHGRVPTLQYWPGLLTICAALTMLWGRIRLCQQSEYLLSLLYAPDSSDNGPMLAPGNTHPTHEGPMMLVGLVFRGLRLEFPGELEVFC
jgi:hypothetical protein